MTCRTLLLCCLFAAPLALATGCGGTDEPYVPEADSGVDNTPYDTPCGVEMRRCTCRDELVDVAEFPVSDAPIVLVGASETLVVVDEGEDGAGVVGIHRYEPSDATLTRLGTVTLDPGNLAGADRVDDDHLLLVMTGGEAPLRAVRTTLTGDMIETASFGDAVDAILVWQVATYGGGAVVSYSTIRVEGEHTETEEDDEIEIQAVLQRLSWSDDTPLALDGAPLPVGNENEVDSPLLIPGAGDALWLAYSERAAFLGQRGPLVLTLVGADGQLAEATRFDDVGSFTIVPGDDRLRLIATTQQFEEDSWILEGRDIDTTSMAISDAVAIDHPDLREPHGALVAYDLGEQIMLTYSAGTARDQVCNTLFLDYETLGREASGVVDFSGGQFLGCGAHPTGLDGEYLYTFRRTTSDASNNWRLRGGACTTPSESDWSDWHAGPGAE